MAGVLLQQLYNAGLGFFLFTLCLRAFLYSLFQLNILHSELAKQLADTMVLPIIQFREKDLTGKFYFKL